MKQVLVSAKVHWKTTGCAFTGLICFLLAKFQIIDPSILSPEFLNTWSELFTSAGLFFGADAVANGTKKATEKTDNPTPDPFDQTEFKL